MLEAGGWVGLDVASRFLVALRRSAVVRAMKLFTAFGASHFLLHPQNMDRHQLAADVVTYSHTPSASVRLERELASLHPSPD